MRHGPGAIIVPCLEQARYHRFTSALASLERPHDSQLIFGVGMSVADNLNSGIRQMRPEDQWSWCIGDDHVFEPNILLRLLDKDADIIAPLCAKRYAPFGLVHFSHAIEGTDGLYHPMRYQDLPDQPFEVAVSGSAMLIRRHVLEELGDPWFVNQAADGWTEEFYFCERAREAGFKVMVDPSVALGHIGHVTVIPKKRDGVWGVALQFAGLGPSEIFYPGGIDETWNLGDFPAPELVEA